MKKKMKKKRVLVTLKKVIIFSHYLGALRYYDRLYDDFVAMDYEIIYGFWRNDSYTAAMKQYCERVGRRYQVLDYRGDFPKQRKDYRRQVAKMLGSLEPDLIVQTNDMHFFQNDIVHGARERGIPSLVVQWANTGPEQLYWDSRKRNNGNGTAGGKGRGKTRVLGIFHGIKGSINRFINRIWGLDYGNKHSLAQGDSDRVAVINDYTRDLLVTQGVAEDKIVVTGHLDYDEAAAASMTANTTADAARVPTANATAAAATRPEDSEDEGSGPEEPMRILFISQPFYTKDLNRISLKEQLDYVRKIYSSVIRTIEIQNGASVNLRFYLKLHPAEKAEDYADLKDLPNLVLKAEFDGEIDVYRSDLVISSHSTVLVSAIIAGKPILTLNILDLPETKEGLSVMGISDGIILSWEQLESSLEKFGKSPESFVREADSDYYLTDGKCRERLLDTINGLVNQ